MISIKKVTLTGLGTLISAGAALFAWKKSEKQRAKFGSWKKKKIENAYYDSRDESDVAW